jgi:nitroreductase
MSEKIKNLVKRIIPEKLRIYRTLLIGYSYDLKRYYKYSNSYTKIDTLQKFEALGTYYYHVVEKGLTMPKPRLGFGKENLFRLINLALLYKEAGYDTKRRTYQHILGVLKEYLIFHKNRNFELLDDIKNKIEELLKGEEEIAPSKQLSFNVRDFFKNKDANFGDFCMSRHTVRNYSDKDIPQEVFDECVKLAQKTPSACNRQPNRMYIVKDVEKQKKILQLQNGNRGFGELANALVVFTGTLSSFRLQGERNEVYFNSGMFAMTFIYALHHYGIGSCALNWSVGPKWDKGLRRLLNIPGEETVTLILSCGYLPENLKIATSPRKGLNEVVKYI